MERAENSDLDISLAILNMRNIFGDKKFRRKVPSVYTIWCIQLDKDIEPVSNLDVTFLRKGFFQSSINTNYLEFL